MEGPEGEETEPLRKEKEGKWNQWERKCEGSKVFQELERVPAKGMESEQKEEKSEFKIEIGHQNKM